jgi:hypothetical protein
MIYRMGEMRVLVYFLIVFCFFNFSYEDSKVFPFAALFYSLIPISYACSFCVGKYNKKMKIPQKEDSFYLLKMAFRNGCRNVSRCHVSQGVGLLCLIQSGILWRNAICNSKSIFSGFSFPKALGLTLVCFAYEALHVENK